MIEYKMNDAALVIKGFYQGSTVRLLKKMDNKYMATIVRNGSWFPNDTIIVDWEELGEKVDISSNKFCI